MTAKEYLSQARYLDNRIKSKLLQIDSLNELATRCTPSYSDMPKSPNREGSRMESAILDIIELEDEISKDVVELVALKKEIVEVIKQVGNKEGGIMTSPTIFGMNGSSLMAGGEAGAEAILPLAGFYKQLEAMISNHLNTSAMEKYLAVIADNSSKGIYLEDGTLVGHLLPAIDGELGKAQKLQRRLSL